MKSLRHTVLPLEMMRRIIPPFAPIATRAPWLLCALLLALGACSSARDQKNATASPPKHRPRPQGPALPGDRVAVVGASLSAGVGAKPLAALLKRSLPPGAKVIDCADPFTFQRPRANTLAQIRKAQAGRAQVVVALDTLFWFAYNYRTWEQKRAYLDVGLKLLEEVKVPLLVGDLPEMRNISPALLPRANIPTPDVLKRLNQRIHQWAKNRPNVRILPMAAWAKPLLGKGKITPVPDRPPIPAADALHVDGLHPNGQGTLYILSRLLREVHRQYPGTPTARYRLNKALIDELAKL